MTDDGYPWPRNVATAVAFAFALWLVSLLVVAFGFSFLIDG